MFSLFVLSLLSAGAQSDLALMADTNFYVAGVSDWKGQVTIQVLSAVDFDSLKKDVALENRALNVAYQNLKFDWRVKFSKATPTDPKPKIPPFPLKRPMPKVFQFYAKLPTAEAAEQRKAGLEERETLRQERLETEKERALKGLSDTKQFALEDKAELEAEWLDRLQTEIKDVKMSLEMGLDPGRKQDPNAANSTKPGGQRVTTKQGPRLGEDGGNIVKEGNIVNDGALKKIR